MHNCLRTGFTLGFVVLLVGAALPFSLSFQVAARHEAATAEERTLDQLDALLSAYKDAETGERGYMLAGQEAYLTPYRRGQDDIRALLPPLRDKLARVSAQRQSFSRLLALDAQFARYQAERIAARRRDDQAGGEHTDHGKRLMDGIRVEVAGLQAHVKARLRNLSAGARQLDEWNRRAIVIVTLIDLLLFGAVYVFALRSLRTQQENGEALQAANSHLLREGERRHADAQQMERHAQRLTQIIATQSELAQSAMDMTHFLDVVVQRMLVLTPASGAVVEMVEGDEMVYRAGSGTVAEFVGLRLQRGSSLSGLCVRAGTVIVSADCANDERVDQVARRKVGAGSMVVAPLFRAGEAVGVVKVIAPTAHGFDGNDIQTLQLMAGMLGAALGNQLQFQRNDALLTERTQTLAALERELLRREKYEIELQRGRERIQSIIAASHEAFICIDSAGLVTDWNARAVSIFGWEQAEVMGQPLEQLIIPETLREKHRQGIAHFLATGEGPVLNRRIELPARRRDGSEIPVELTITVLRKEGAVEFPCFLHDISERKHSEALLLKQQETLRSISDNLPALVGFVDSEERFQYCNRQFQAMLGLDVLGMTLEQAMGKEFHTAIAPLITAALQGEPARSDSAMMTLQGMRDFEGRFIPQTDIGGNVVGFHIIAWDITERKQREREWQSRASVDALTGLLNRAFFLEALELALRRHRRTGEALAVLYLDIDHFKQINDQHGHAAGDAVLQAFAGYLKGALRESDIVGRFGGDEFCVALDNVQSPDNAAAVAEKILAAAQQPVLFQGTSLSISTSIGIAFVDMPALRAEHLIPMADAALYRAKQAGRNRYSLDVVPPASMVFE
ncbi:diguanylate cyclase [Chitinimonas arctica]|uniref:Diguanylate cyclase n=1 Tax=Chitinimonas arctica TaxID=2594795 RepID=A0A516SBA2_9NEIS|nr:diguanylate cyclase [Chitinimonas arctica]QDQ25424.1 diguanylate cyclase [Chitinimonas arctica]